VVRLTDYMPWQDDPNAAIHEVHRRIECIEGEAHLDVVFDPRFDYARDPPRFDVTPEGVLACGARGERLVAVVSGGPAWEARPEGGMRCRLRLRAGERRWMVLSWSAPRPEPIAAYRPFEHLRRTRQAWRAWSASLSYDGPWRHHVVRSALALKLMLFAPSGAMVAAPTTSLPEWPGGARNWDYRYTWVRDSALAIRALNLVGCAREARDFFHFVRRTIDLRHGLRVMYTVQGGQPPAETVLDHLRGFGGARPVRVGNDARDQHQLDTAGALLDAAYLHEQFGGTLSLRTWRTLYGLVEGVAAHWCEADHGIWEPRSGVRHNVHSKVMCWLALDRGARLATLFGAAEARRRWLKVAAEVRADVQARGVDPTGRHFVGHYGGESADAALLLVPIYEMLPPVDPLATRTVEFVRSTLGAGPFVYRYPLGADDGVGGPEGAFVLCGFWLAEALACAGRLGEAQDVFAAHVDASNHLGLLSEEIDPASQTLLGNFPQAFSHVGLINAATAIDRGLQLRDEGSRKSSEFGPPAWRP
jgi:GH15 family glucan-1,4-alpha-glucosidase